MGKKLLFEEVKNKDGIGSKPVPTRMTKKESEFKKELKQLRARRDALEAKIEKMENSCKHRVCFDVAGSPYDARFCNLCGVGRGLI